MNNQEWRQKNTSCNNFSTLSVRDSAIRRIQILDEIFDKSETEIWLPLKENPNYIISSWGRVMHLKSYGGKIRILTPTIRLNKYPYITITLDSKRKGIRLIELTLKYFSSN